MPFIPIFWISFICCLKTLGSQMQKTFRFILFLGLFAAQTYAQGLSVGTKLIDYLINDSGVIEILSKRGIQGTPAQNVQTYIKNALVAFNLGNRDLTKDELRQILIGLNVSGDDLRLKNQLVELLEKTSDDLSTEDVVTAINNLIYLANRHGVRGSVVLACSQCVSDSLTRHGFKFTFATIQDSTTANILDKMLPRNPRDLSNFISAKMKKMGLGSYRNVPKEIVALEEERSLGLFLALAESGSKEHKQLVEAVIDVSRRPDGTVNLLDTQNPHKLWSLFSNDMDENMMANWTKLLKDVAEEGKSEISKKEAFFAVLTKQAGDDPVLLEHKNMLRSKNCFFK